MPNDIHKEFEAQHLHNQRRMERRIRKAYEDAIQEVALSINQVNYNGGVFQLKDYPALQSRINKQIERIHASVYGAVVNSIKESWDLSNEKNDLLVDKRLAGKKLSRKAKQILYDPNINARDQFISRTEKGLNLSDRVWIGLQGYRTEMEQALGIGVSEGKSALEMAGDLKKYLREPNKLFRRVREIKGDPDSTLKLSKAAKDYHPGQGVYRSSFMNSKRLAVTENNMAYRNADQERWQKLPFVTGFEVKLSNNHPQYDICDKLKGTYPKDFVWNGWHPFCRCYKIPKQVSDAEYEKLEDAMLAGEDLPEVEQVTDPPKAFDQFVQDNRERMEKWSNRPYWMRDNPDYISKAKASIEGPSATKSFDFKPAKSLKEAEDFAIANGLAKKVSYKGLKDVAIANETNKVLLELKSQGIAYDNVTSLRKVFNSNGREKFMLQNSTQLEFDKKGNVIREENTLILNKAFFDKHPTLDEVNKVAKGLRDRQWGTSESYKDMVWHEAGHRLTAKNIYINRTVANKESLVDDISRLGRYSKKNLDENLSEIFAFYKKTGDAPKEWKELFNKYSIIKI